MFWLVPAENIWKLIIIAGFMHPFLNVCLEVQGDEDGNNFCIILVFCYKNLKIDSNLE